MHRGRGVHPFVHFPGPWALGLEIFTKIRKTFFYPGKGTPGYAPSHPPPYLRLRCLVSLATPGPAARGTYLSHHVKAGQLARQFRSPNGTFTLPCCCNHTHSLCGCDTSKFEYFS